MLPRDIEPVTFEVIRNALDTLADEMALTILRTAYSGIVKDAMDFSTGFADRNGETVAMGLTIAFHVGSFPSAVRSILRKFDGRIFPGDVYIMNDPYTSGGIHLPDVYVIKPVFAEDELQGFSCTVAHQTDIGGIVPGSNSTNSHEIYQEGLRIPTTKLYERGIPNETMFDLLATNVRVPDKVLGDIRAEIAAATLGERQFLDLVGRYGASGVSRYMDALLEYSERRVRQEITELPDGVYDFTHYIDGDNIETGDVVINLSMVIEGDGIAVDFTGSSPQVKAGINSPFPFTKSSVWGGIRQIMDPEIPNSSGSHHPIKVTSPEATVVNPVLPAPCGARGIVGYRIMEAVWGSAVQGRPRSSAGRRRGRKHDHQHRRVRLTTQAIRVRRSVRRKSRGQTQRRRAVRNASPRRKQCEHARRDRGGRVAGANRTVRRRARHCRSWQVPRRALHRAGRSPARRRGRPPASLGQATEPGLRTTRRQVWVVLVEHRKPE